ncbi:MAG: ribonuclease, Rne/Rng family [Acidobacteriales bacterium]|nr:ribonuclease, Rne/Rng family [Terriglobales bacterium]
MSKELFVTSTPHETKLAVVEDDQVVEVFFERENEYTLAGSIYKGRVTRVLPGMQSAFVDIGLERDAFLYVTDFLEEVEESDDLDTVQALPAKTNAEPEREHREPRDQREHRGRGRRTEQNRAANAAALQRPIEEVPTPPDGDETVDAVVESAASSEGQPAEASADTGDRGPRRWRGRRGRRRGRGGLSESKFATPPEASADGEQPQAVEQDEQQEETISAHSDSSNDNEVDVNREEPVQSEPETRKRPVAADAPGQPARNREQRDREPQKQQQRPQRILLPGESLAKYNPRAESAAAKAEPVEPKVESRFQKVAPKPSTEVSITPAALSASHGLLPGESLAKYRNRPAQAEPAAVVAAVEPTAEHSHGISHEDHVAATPAPEAVDETRRPRRGWEHEQHSKPAAQAAAPAPVEVEERHSRPANPPAQEQQETEERGTGDYNFSPGQGVIEEEEISEEEHELSPTEEHMEEGEYEDLEEETLDVADHHEDEVIAAGEGLAAALAESRSPEKSDNYMAETESEDSQDEDGDDDDEFENESEELEEAEMLADSEEGNEISEPDPEDPNYSGRVELRAPSGTAGFQQKTERRPDRAGRGRKGGRNQRGGRPMRSGGGPRRNIQRGPMPQINDLLKEGQEILVQIAKEPMAKKGARITSHIALPGRFLVFMPTVNHTGVSRKIGSEEERQRLKRILISEKGQSHGGFIVRTAAAGASEEDLRADIRFLINLWNEIKQRAETSKAPALIYHDLNLVERILRDQVTTTFSQIWVDSEQEYERILRFASRFQPSLVRRVKLYTKETPLFEQFNVQDEINKALKSKVWLKSGGYIVINQTEALVAIDINTGKYVGKTARLEDTIVKTNVDAIKEIVRQIRLRDLGGIIVIDFIDMDERKNRQKVMQALEEALKADRSPSKVLQFNDFGLVAITRKRVKQSLERTLGTQCVYCTGTGMIKSVATVCNEIYVELRKMARHLDGQQVTLRVNPEVGKALKENGGKWLQEMEEIIKKTVIVKSDALQHQEQFEIL